ncbi:serine/threonine-protein kinase [Granulicella sp. dw_53]|uniref:serine/threonine-protein kinase n=1 Tax=Granulicella sp. dw_53 TaxID=2719792 RepID=UPI001BD5C367|nr:serine/threonine-protein kinase [Granulicella sp. dw_53]
MTPAQWDVAKEIFDAAISLSPHARLNFARNACAHEPEVLNEVQQLLEAYASAPSSFLKPIWDESSVATPSLEPGDVISARYQIVRRIGAGGMGQVYEARDLTLDVTVALKMLRSDIAADPEMLFRFHQEVRIAHRVTHPNVCRTFHLDREISHVSSHGGPPTDLTFIIMEFLEGETLQQLLKREGCLTQDRALGVIRQMAAALEAAHRTGVIHRDIKPGNVMICPAARDSLQPVRVVITDFGLAKSGGPVGADLSSVSHPGAAIGTLSYMSPEQLQGLPVTSATDIYAFGLVLFEAVTGRKAFPNASTFPGALERLTQQVPSACGFVTGLPAVWDAAISGCLAIEPTMRFEHASDVIAMLEGEKLARSIPQPHFAKRLSVSSPLQGFWYRNKIWAIFLSLILCVALLWRPFRLSKSRSDGRVAPGTLVYLAPIRNTTGDAQLENVIELAHAGLSQSTQINLLDRGSVAEILGQMTKPHDITITDPIAREIAMRANASRIIFLTLSRSGSRHNMTVEIQRPDLTTPLRVREHWTKVFEWTQPSQPQPTVPSDLLDAIRNATDWVRSTVGESSGDVTSLSASPESVTTDNWDALTAFRQAESFDAQHRKWEAVLALRKATAFDPHFALAYARLGDILFNINRDAEGLDAYRHALDASTDRTLSRRELDRVQGMYAIDGLDYLTAVAAFKDYAAFYPNDYIGWAYPTSALRALGRDEEAVANLRRAVALAPSLPFPMIELANELAIIGQPAEGQTWVESLRRKGYETAAKELEVRLRFLSLDFAGALQFARELEASNDLPRRLRTYRTHLRLAAELDDYDQAIQVANQGVIDSLASGEQATQAAILVDRASLECQQGQIQPCVADIDKALSLDEGLNTLRAAEDTLGPAATSAETGERKLIRVQLARLAKDIDHNDFGYTQRFLHTRAHAELLLADGNIDAALEEMRRAGRLDAPTASHEYLGRTLLIAARTSKFAAHTRQLRQEALNTFAVVARSPRAAVLRPWDKPPGTLSTQTATYLQIARALREPALGISKDFSLYAHLRPHALSPK